MKGVFSHGISITGDQPPHPERCDRILAECDENYAQRVSLAADKILSNLEASPIVLLSGPSGSGKTTTAMKIAGGAPAAGVNTTRWPWTTTSRRPILRPRPHPGGGAGF